MAKSGRAHLCGACRHCGLQVMCSSQNSQFQITEAAKSGLKFNKGDLLAYVFPAYKWKDDIRVVWSRFLLHLSMILLVTPSSVVGFLFYFACFWFLFFPFIQDGCSHSRKMAIAIPVSNTQTTIPRRWKDSGFHKDHISVFCILISLVMYPSFNKSLWLGNCDALSD